MTASPPKKSKPVFFTLRAADSEELDAWREGSVYSDPLGTMEAPPGAGDAFTGAPRPAPRGGETDRYAQRVTSDAREAVAGARASASARLRGGAGRLLTRGVRMGGEAGRRARGGPARGRLRPPQVWPERSEGGP